MSATELPRLKYEYAAKAYAEIGATWEYLERKAQVLLSLTAILLGLLTGRAGSINTSRLALERSVLGATGGWTLIALWVIVGLLLFLALLHIASAIRTQYWTLDFPAEDDADLSDALYAAESDFLEPATDRSFFDTVGQRYATAAMENMKVNEEKRKDLDVAMTCILGASFVLLAALALSAVPYVIGGG